MKEVYLLWIFLIVTVLALASSAVYGAHNEAIGHNKPTCEEHGGTWKEQDKGCYFVDGVVCVEISNEEGSMVVCSIPNDWTGI